MLQRENKGKRVVLYPHYFDSKVPRSRGRRVPLDLAVRDPKPEEILEAARNLGLEAFIENARYPREWWRLPGRVVVEKKGLSKTIIVQRIAQELSKKRSRKG